MRHKILFLAALCFAVPAAAGPVEDATVALTTMMDRFNGGDAAAFIAGHQDDAVIVDEFAPYMWTGAGTAERWIGDYARDATARGISEGRVDYGAPIQANSDGQTAYIVLPTTYRFLQNGTRMAGRGNMTFMMRRNGTDWKVASWTYAGATPTAE